MKLTSLARLVPALGTALLVVMLAEPAVAQAPSPPPGYPSYPAPTARNPACVRLEAQLASLDRGVQDPNRAEQIRRYEEAASKQQAELDRVVAQSRRLGCQGSGFFALFSGQPQQCGALNNQIQRMRANLDDMHSTLQRLQGSTADREGERRSILVALGQNDCGPQYRQFANRGRDLFETLFGPNPSANPDLPPSGTYRTVCVRTCDGYFFPISYSTVPSRFGDDEKTCQRLCPAAEVVLYSHRNPGEDINQAVSVSGRLYTELPNAFAYRKEFNAACACKRPGQTWADALKHLDDQVNPGDIVVTEERAKLLSQPRVDAQGKPIRQAPPPRAQQTPATPKSPQTATPADADPDPTKRKVRSVGPAFYPVR